MFKNIQGSTEDVDFLKNTEPGTIFLAGPTCIYYGKEVPYTIC